MRYGAERVFSSEASNITEEDVDALIAKVQGQGWPLPWLGMRSDVVSTSLVGRIGATQAGWRRPSRLPPMPT